MTKKINFFLKRVKCFFHFSGQILLFGKHFGLLIAIFLACVVTIYCGHQETFNHVKILPEINLWQAYVIFFGSLVGIFYSGCLATDYKGWKKCSL